MQNKLCKFIKLGCGIIAFFSFLSIAIAHPTGATGFLTTGCTSCHGTSPSSAVTLSAQSTTGWTVSTGGTLSISLSVNKSGGLISGIDIGIVDGSGTELGSSTAGTNLKLDATTLELTHPAAVAMIGGVANYTFQWTAPQTGGTYYLKAAGLADNDTWNFLTTVNITVTQPASISLTSPVGSEAFCEGVSNNITWASTNVSNVKIELSSDGGITWPTIIAPSVPASTGSYAWMVPTNITIGKTFRVRVSDVSNSSTNSVSTANFYIESNPQIINQPPLSDSTCEGQPMTISVTASGDDLRYQWRKNTFPITGQTSSAIVFDNISQTDIGMYDCQITGYCGGVITSSGCMINVKGYPKILNQLNDTTVCEGTDLVYSINATGYMVKYQWQKDGVDITGANLSTFTLNSLTTNLSAGYSCIVKNECGEVTSSSSELYVIPLPTITNQPQDITVLQGETITASVTADGSGLSYIWEKDGTKITDQTDANLNITNAKLTDAGKYDCIVSNRCGTITSKQIEVTVNQNGSGPILFLIYSTIDFGVVAPNSTSDTLVKGIIKNAGSLDLNISKITLQGTNASEFSIVSGNTIPLIIKEGDSASMEFKFSPSSKGLKVAQVVFVSDSPTNPNLTLTGQSGTELEATDVSSIDFGKVGQDTSISFQFQNLGSVNVVISKFTFAGTRTQDFSVTSPSCNTSVSSGGIQPITVMYSPKANGGVSDDSLKIQTITGKFVMVHVKGESSIVGVNDQPSYLNNFTIYPNPASESLTLQYSLSEPSDVTLTVYDILGNILLNKQITNSNSGVNFERWIFNSSGFNPASGNYFAQIKAGTYSQTIPFIILQK